MRISLYKLGIPITILILIINEEVMYKIRTTVVSRLLERVFISYFSKRVPGLVLIDLELIDVLHWMSLHLLVSPAVDTVLIAQNWRTLHRRKHLVLLLVSFLLV